MVLCMHEMDISDRSASRRCCGVSKGVERGYTQRIGIEHQLSDSCYQNSIRKPEMVKWQERRHMQHNTVRWPIG